jgi:hypothetical protein
MMMSRLGGLFAVIPAAVLLTISFFVLLGVRKAESQGLRAFGYVIAALLWAAVLLVISSGIYMMSTGRPPMICPMQQMMQGQMQGMMKGEHTPAAMQEKGEMPMMKH